MNQIKLTEPKLNVSRPILYEYITDNWSDTPDGIAAIFKELNTDFVLRAFFRWEPMTQTRYNWLKNVISIIKTKNPNIKLCGGLPAHRINYNDINDITGIQITKEQAYNMAIDPAKWGFSSPTKQELQDNISDYFNVSGAGAYFSDMSNIQFREIALSWAKIQIDAGVDAIWIDLLFNQTRFFYNLANKNPDHQSVVDSYNGIIDFTNKIREYGLTKGKKIYVGSWTPLGFEPVCTDFMTKGVLQCDVACGKIDKNAWIAERDRIRKTFGNIPIMAYIDWGGTNGPMQVFSQMTGAKDARITYQRNALTEISRGLKDIGIHFVYPVHGGDLTTASKPILSYEKYNRYDSKAPEFDTYNTIKEIINR